MQAPPGTGTGSPFHSNNTRRSSAASINGSSDRRRSGCAARPSSNVWKCPSSRVTVAASNRSVRYTTATRRPWGSSVASSERSTWAAPLSTGCASIRSPGTSIGGRGAFCKANITWNSGDTPSRRSGRSASTTFSKGRSWWAKAPSTVSCTRPSSSRKDGSPERSVRSASVLTNRPTSPSSSARLRPATGAPTTTSSWPL